MHNIEKTIILDARSPIRNVIPEKNEVTIYNKLEEYILNCSQGLSLVSLSVDKTNLAIQYLAESYTNPPKVENVSIDEHIEFSIENFFIRSQAIYDRVLIFVNKLHDIGLSDESISHNVIVTNDHVISSGLNSALKKLRKTCTEYRVERNKIIHHGRYSEEKFNNLALMHKAHELSKLDNKESGIDLKKLDALSNIFIEIQVDDFNEHLKKIIKSLYIFFEVAEKVYLERREWYLKTI